MAIETDNASTFRVIAGILAILMIVAAGLIYLQSGTDDGPASDSAVLAAVSQSIPLHANAAIAGEAGAFDALATDLQRLTETRRGASLPGGAAAWDGLERNAGEILARRSDVETVTAAATAIDQRMPAIIERSDALLGQSGASAEIQEFRRRSVSLQAAVSGLAASAVSGDPAPLAASIASDLAYLRSLLDAFAGNASDLDVAALEPGAAESSLIPLTAEIDQIESAIDTALSVAPDLAGMAEARDAVVNAAADLLYGEFSVAGASAGGTAFSAGLVPVVLLAIGLVFLGGLVFLHSRAAVFEKASRVQAEQNERNQQAILRLLDELGSLADGDLTVEATVTEDITGAIADSINYAIEKLRELVATINETAIMVDSAAKQTENTAVHMARAADTQTREIAAATESIVSMAGSIEEVSGNAERSSDVARHSVEVAHKGGEAVRRTIDGMNTIRETIQDTSKRIKRLGESSQEIGNIIELINDIAEQTNILALNASIQASMAGEAGRGFAVVADEVQRLAERSTNATRQIEVLVRTIQSDTNEAVVSMERSTTDVVGGALLAENAGAALDEIEQVSNQIASLVQNISGSAREQAGSAADVTRRTTKLKEISDQTGRATTATAASISKLSELASQLRQSVAGFTLPSSASPASALSTPARPAAPEKAEVAKEQVAG